MTHSIRRRLLALLLPASFVVWFIATAFTYIDARSEVEKLFDAQLAQSGRVLLALSLHELVEQRLLGESSGPGVEAVNKDIWQKGSEYEKKLAFQVWLNQDTLSLRSENAPGIKMTAKQDGYSDEIIEGESWRVFAVQTEDGLFAVQIAEQLDIRHDLVNSVVLRTMLPLLVALPLLAGLLWYGVGRGMSPLNRVAQEILERNPNDLTAIPLDQIPTEAKPLTDALNTVFEQLKTAFDTERRFTADAAHELRTPLAALKTHAEIALQAQNDEDQKQALRQVVRGVNRATRLVEQLLTLARLDPASSASNVKRFDLFIIAENVISDEAPIAINKNIEISLNGTRGKFVHSNADAIAVMMRNLIDNAIRYTPEGGEVEVIIHRFDNEISFKVCDSGTGIPEEERPLVLQRFYRRLGTKATGSGLGLSIVMRIVDLYNLKITLGEAERLGGLEVDVCFRTAD